MKKVVRIPSSGKGQRVSYTRSLGIVLVEIDEYTEMFFLWWARKMHERTTLDAASANAMLSQSARLARVPTFLRSAAPNFACLETSPGSGTVVSGGAEGNRKFDD